MPKRETKQQERPSALKELREAAGLTQEQVAYHLKKAASTIRRWEKGDEPSMTRREWLEFCKIINKEFDELPELLSAPVPDESLYSEHPQETE
ncbi:MAG: helix-turn-helix transcriptional regulator [Richelia sp. RM2_1_2]|nr:helix-turn-helix transcriptional regulator [Richelia sp. RM1_1_1]NJO61332.1 helix-turn-helix transcriptional regulator [Richelia sp. RM2_1_2]